jgi:peptidyl-prolyl cis-trans isomerase SurA
MMRLLSNACIALLLSGCVFTAAAQTTQVAPKSQAEGKPSTQEQAKADAHKLPAERGDVVDRIAATVNGDIILESDVEEEERFTKLYPYGDGEGKPVHEQAITRIIDRALIVQQQRGFPQTPVSDEDVTKEENDLRNDLPSCAKADCKTDAGWKAFLNTFGFTEDELRTRLRLRIQILHFIETRFRAGIRISDHQISDYYNNTMLPEYKKTGGVAPPLDTVEDRIGELLLEQQVSVLLDQWLTTLRDSGNVRIMQHGVVSP